MKTAEEILNEVERRIAARRRRIERINAANNPLAALAATASDRAEIAELIDLREWIVAQK